MFLFQAKSIKVDTGCPKLPLNFDRTCKYQPVDDIYLAISMFYGIQKIFVCEKRMTTRKITRCLSSIQNINSLVSVQTFEGEMSMNYSEHQGVCNVYLCKMSTS